MKKGKYIDIYVIMACMSRRKPKTNLKQVDEILEKACENVKKQVMKKSGNESRIG